MLSKAELYIEWCSHDHRNCEKQLKLISQQFIIFVRL